MKRRSFYILVGLLGLATACQDPVLVPAASLDGPTAIEFAVGTICLRGDDSGNLRTVVKEICADRDPSNSGEPRKVGGVGLLVNENSDRLSFFSVGGEVELANLRSDVPGVTHTPVGRLPVDVAASPDGTVAYTLNQIDRDISIVSLWDFEPLPQRYVLPRTPIAFDVRKSTGDIIVAVNAPTTLLSFGGSSCANINDCVVDDRAPITLDLRGTITDMVISPRNDKAYVTYRELDEIDVIDLDSFQISNTIPVAFECSDGIDNDGDGLIDQADVQCYGPNGAESPGGAGRDAQRDCADEIDNDMDGLIDRDDPDCLGSAGTEDSGSPPPASACSDGVDNDDDGLADYPNDPKCYGAYGRTENARVQRGFDAIDIDELAAFVYAVDRARNQVVVIDATREVLIDAPASAIPSGSVVSANFGMPTAPSPLDVVATVDRLCIDPRSDQTISCTELFLKTIYNPAGLYGRPVTTINEPDIAVRYEYNAWVSEDTGRLRKLRVMTTYCHVPITAASFPELTSPFTDLEAYEQSPEAGCFVVPELPLVARDDWQGSCDAPCVDCDEEELKERFYCQDASGTPTGVIVNPLMSIEDLDRRQAVFAQGRCDKPPAIDAEMREFAANNNAPRNFSCVSNLLPQPMELDLLRDEQAVDEDGDPLFSRNRFSRADSFLARRRAESLRQSRYLSSYEDEFGNLPVAGGDPVAQFTRFERSYDERIFNETWSVSYEGELPDARRSDGLVARDTEEVDGVETVVFSAGGLDVCAAGVEVGDLLTITSPLTDVADCVDLDGGDEFLTYRVVDRDASSYRLAVISCIPPDEGWNVWTGAVDSAWNNPDNWEKGRVPLTTDEVYICGEAPNQPVLSEDTEVADIILAADGQVDLAGFDIAPLLPEAQETPIYAQSLPRFECFETGTSYSVRPYQAWTVSGSRSGFSSPNESVFGECLPVLGSDLSEQSPDDFGPARMGRVKTGEVFYGPYLSFWVYPGPNRVVEDDVLEDVPAIPPVRGIRFEFAVDANLLASNANTGGVFPSKVDIYALDGAYRLVSSEANSNFLFHRAARSVSDVGATVR